MVLSRLFTELDREPFVPFVIELENGRAVQVRHPENVFIIPNRSKVLDIQVFNDQTDEIVAFGPTAITDLSHPRGGNGP